MKNFFLRILINAGAVYLAVWLLQPHIIVQNQVWYAYLVLGLIFGLVNAIIKPLVMFASCPVIILTLGLGTLVVNTFLFLLTGWIGTMVNFGFTIPENALLYAFLGALIVYVASSIFTGIFASYRRR